MVNCSWSKIVNVGVLLVITASLAFVSSKHLPEVSENGVGLEARSGGDQRGVKYSYFYLSRRIFYLPLYYLFYFAFYLLVVLGRSVIKHHIGEFHRSMPWSASDLAEQLSNKVHLYMNEFRNKYLQK